MRRRQVEFRLHVRRPDDGADRTKLAGRQPGVDSADLQQQAGLDAKRGLLAASR